MAYKLKLASLVGLLTYLSLSLVVVFQAQANIDYLADPQNRVSTNFKIPVNLKKRVGFWFDIYTKYSSSQYIIHHSDYPWIIFDVVDVRSILEGSGHKWTKHHLAEKEVRNRKRHVISSLQLLSRKNNVIKLTPELDRLRILLSEIPAPQKNVAKAAALRVRSQLGQKDFIASGLIEGARYLSHMESVFQTHRLPIELTRLPLVESSFNTAAVSRVGASGVWQLMPAMGRKFLKMHGALDERNSPLKATHAAAQILKQNHKILRSWALAVTAYNHGPSGIRRAAIHLGTLDLANIISVYRGRDFGFATANFYSEFLAALFVERYQKEVFGDLPTNAAMIYSVLTLPRPLKIRALTKAMGLKIEDLQTFNPELNDVDIRPSTMLPRGYQIFVPPASARRLKRVWAVPLLARQPNGGGQNKFTIAP